MKPETGRLLRRFGLMIEFIGLAWLMLVRRGIVARANLEGTDPTLAAKVALLVGFTVWAVGNAVIYWPRRPTNAAKSTDELG